MTDWNILIDAGKELTRAFVLLDRADEMQCGLVAAMVVTKTGLVGAAQDCVNRVDRMLGRPA